MKHVLRYYCITCGLLVGPACLAVILALAVGILPQERIKAALAMISTDTPLPTASVVDVPVEEKPESEEASVASPRSEPRP